MTAVELRPMTEAEYDAWVPGAIEGYAAEHVRAGSKPADTALESSRKEFADLLPDGTATAEHHLLVGLAEGERVGLLWLRIPAVGTPRSAFVYDVEVDAAERGRGFGRGLMEAAESYARDHGATALRLHVFGHNTVARNLYTSLGYEVTNVGMAKALYPTS